MFPPFPFASVSLCTLTSFQWETGITGGIGITSWECCWGELPSTHFLSSPLSSSLVPFPLSQPPFCRRFLFPDPPGVLPAACLCRGRPTPVPALAAAPTSLRGEGTDWQSPDCSLAAPGSHLPGASGVSSPQFPVLLTLPPPRLDVDAHVSRQLLLAKKWNKT